MPDKYTCRDCIWHHKVSQTDVCYFEDVFCGEIIDFPSRLCSAFNGGREELDRAIFSVLNKHYEKWCTQDQIHNEVEWSAIFDDYVAIEEQDLVLGLEIDRLASEGKIEARYTIDPYRGNVYQCRLHDTETRDMFEELEAKHE